MTSFLPITVFCFFNCFCVLLFTTAQTIVFKKKKNTKILQCFAIVKLYRLCDFKSWCFRRNLNSITERLLLEATAPSRSGDFWRLFPFFFYGIYITSTISLFVNCHLTVRFVSWRSEQKHHKLLDYLLLLCFTFHLMYLKACRHKNRYSHFYFVFRLRACPFLN